MSVLFNQNGLQSAYELTKTLRSSPAQLTPATERDRPGSLTRSATECSYLDNAHTCCSKTGFSPGTP